MLHTIHVFLYEMRFGLLILLLPMFWSMWIFWVYFTTPGKISSGTETFSRKRHSHRMRQQGKQQSTHTLGKDNSETGIAIADEPGQQSNLLDALAAEEEYDDEDEPSAFQAASTLKQPIVDKDVLVNQLVDNVTDKVAAQLEALTGHAVHDDLNEVDVQDMLETVQEDSETDNKVLADTEDDMPEGEHTAAIRKASKMEEIGFHRTTEDDEDAQAEADSILSSPEVAGLAAKHVARISDLGLVDGPGDEKERLRTAQLDDILGKLDNILGNEDSDEDEAGSSSSTVTEPENKSESQFSNASTQKLKPVTDSGILEAQVDNNDEESVDDENGDAEIEANSFFANLSEEETSAAFDQMETIQEESDDVAVDDVDEDQAVADDSGANFLREMSEISEVPSETDESQNLDAFDQLETVKVEIGSEPDLDAGHHDEHDLLETIAVENIPAQESDPNMETATEDTGLEALEHDNVVEDRRKQKSEDDDDDDLPAWARADSFDDDDDDNGPKQQNLFD